MDYKKLIKVTDSVDGVGLGSIATWVSSMGDNTVTIAMDLLPNVAEASLGVLEDDGWELTDKGADDGQCYRFTKMFKVRF